MEICIAFLLALSPLEGCFWSQLSVVDAEGERKFGFSILSQKPLIPPAFLCFCLSLTSSLSVFPLYFSLCA